MMIILFTTQRKRVLNIWCDKSTFSSPDANEQLRSCHIRHCSETSRMPNATNTQHNKGKWLTRFDTETPPNYWMSAFVSLLSGLISWDIWYCQPNTSQWSPDISAMARHHIFRVLWTDKTLTRSVWDSKIGRLMLTLPTPNLINIVDTVNVFQ